MTRSSHGALRRRILSWYGATARPLPWRNIKDPFRIIVSEVMLQQTQVSRVLVKYPQFVKQFRSFRGLSTATPGSVLRAWKGMGYYNRAIRLRELGKVVTHRLHGRLPRTVEGLQKLPGIGPYTARAVACFAFGVPTAVVDTNVSRVLARLFPKATRRLGFQAVADEFLPRRSAYNWNQAMMDFGATICTARSPRCRHCPLRNLCPSAHRVQALKVSATTEPTRAGIPRRIYRGRIIDALMRRRSMTLGDIGRAILTRYSDRDESWLREVLLTLERDGLLSLRRIGRFWIVSLVA